MRLVSVFFLSLLVFMTSCSKQNDQQLKEQIRQVIKEDPKILFDAIEAKPLEFMESLQKVAKEAQSQMVKKREEDEKKELQKSYENPMMANIRGDENIRGPKDAPLTLVEYSDFECPFCSRAFQNVKQLTEKYNGKIRFIYKHLPLSFHPNAMGAAKYMEAIRLQSPEKSWKFHDDVFNNQGKVKNGEAYFKAVAKELKVDMTKLAKDLDSDSVKNRIKEDMEEAQKFGFEGTPGFIFNGVPLKGAYPVEHFDQIVEELKKRGKITL